MMGEALIGLQERTSDPASMPSGWGRIFFKNDKRLYVIDDTLTVSKVALAGDAPTAHAASHVVGGGDPLTLDAGQVVSGILDGARIPAIALSATTGVLPVEKGGSGSSTRPNFFAYLSVDGGGMAHGITSVVPLDATLSDFDNTDFNLTTYQFTPSVAGFYLISFQVSFLPTDMVAGTPLFAIVRKTGYLYMVSTHVVAVVDYMSIAGATIMYLNGTTDYVDLAVRHHYGAGLTAEIQGESKKTHLAGFLLAAGDGS